MANAVPLAHVLRSGLEESVHLGHVAVCDSTGQLVASAGDPSRLVFARSSMKPLQASVSLAAMHDDDLPVPMLARPVLFRRVDAAIARILEEPPVGTIAAALADHPDAVTDLRIALAAGYDTTSHTLAWTPTHMPDRVATEAASVCRSLAPGFPSAP